MLIVSPLVLFLRKPHLADGHARNA
jgi:hypothetical protein